MLRVIQAAVVLMGGLVLMMTGMVGWIRHSEPTPFYWLVVCCETRKQDGGLYLLEPFSGITESFTAYSPYTDFVTTQGDWVIYAAGDFANGSPSIYRKQVGGEPDLLMEGVMLLKPMAWSISPNGQWLVVSRDTELSHEWYGVPLAGGLSYELTAGLESLGYTLNDVDRLPVFSPDSEWVVFEAMRESDRQIDIFRVRLDGSGLENMTPTLPQAVMALQWIGDQLIGAAYQDGVFFRVDMPTNTVQLFSDDTGLNAYGMIRPLGPTQLWFGKNASGQFAAYRLPEMTEIWTENGDVPYFTASDDGSRLFLQIYPLEWVLRRADSAAQVRLQPPTDDFGIETVVWSPNKASVLVQLHRKGQHEIWRIDEQNPNDPQKLWSTPDEVGRVWWSPSGIGIAINSYRPSGGGAAVTVSADGTVRTVQKDALPLGWGPRAIDRPMNGNALAGIGVLLCSIGMGMIFGRFRKA